MVATSWSSVQNNNNCGSSSGDTNAFHNLISHQPDKDKILNIIECWNDIDNIYENSDE